jgi:hypothetical protein
MKKVILVSTCTNSKTVSIGENKKLRNCSSVIYDQAISAWCKSLWSDKEDQVAARTLYGGSHWGETRKAFEKLSAQSSVSSELWILSAGCGLIPADLEVPAYTATFSSGADGIHELIWQPGWSPKERAQYWWKEINARKPPGIPRTLTDIGGDGDTLWLFVLSKEYMPAIEQELFELISSGQNVLIASAGAYANRQSLHPVIQPRLFSLSEKFETYRQVLHGAKVALNANFAHWLTTEHMEGLQQNSESLLSTIAKIDESLPDPSSMDEDSFIDATRQIGSDLAVEELKNLWTKRNRETVPMTDEEVMEFIDACYEPGFSSATQLLRKLRHEELRSCEQKRFGALFKLYENRNQLSLFDE